MLLKYILEIRDDSNFFGYEIIFFTVFIYSDDVKLLSRRQL